MVKCHFFPMKWLLPLNKKADKIGHKQGSLLVTWECIIYTLTKVHFISEVPSLPNIQQKKWRNFAFKLCVLYWFYTFQCGSGSCINGASDHLSPRQKDHILAPGILRQVFISFLTCWKGFTSLILCKFIIDLDSLQVHVLKVFN